MIEVTQLSGKTYWLNPHNIESIEATPDTMIALQNGKKIVVREDVATVIQRIIEYRRRLGMLSNEE
jgi:flagellar protein FlbD